MSIPGLFVCCEARFTCEMNVVFPLEGKTAKASGVGSFADALLQLENFYLPTSQNTSELGSPATNDVALTYDTSGNFSIWDFADVSFTKPDDNWITVAMSNNANGNAPQ